MEIDFYSRSSLRKADYQRALTRDREEKWEDGESKVKKESKVTKTF